MADEPVTLERVGGVTVAAFPPGTDLNSTTTEPVRVALSSAVEQADGPVLLDFQNVEFISSLGIGMLVTLRLTAARTGHRLLLAGLHQNIAGVLEVMKMTTIFELYPSVAAALDDLADA